MTKLKPLSTAQRQVINDIASLLVAGELDKNVFPGYIKHYRERMTPKQKQVARRLDGAVREHRDALKGGLGKTLKAVKSD